MKTREQIAAAHATMRRAGEELTADRHPLAALIAGADGALAWAAGLDDPMVAEFETMLADFVEQDRRADAAKGGAP